MNAISILRTVLLFVVFIHNDVVILIYGFNVIPRSKISSRSLQQQQHSLSSDPLIANRSLRQQPWTICSLSDNSNSEQVMESIQSLVDFHQGTWIGTSVRSFTVSDDIAAGIIDRKYTDSPNYKCTVKFGYDAQRKDYQFTESIDFSTTTGTPNTSSSKSIRTVPFSLSCIDVDSVDASYSLDMTLPEFPAVLAGTNKLLQFGIEHCIATNENTRIRAFAFYGDTTQQLIRIVISTEKRDIQQDNEISEKILQQQQDNENKRSQEKDKIISELQTDVDRLVDKIVKNIQVTNDSNNNNINGKIYNNNESRIDQMERLQQSINSKQPTKSSLSADESPNDSYTPHTITLLEASSGIWVGDSVIRDLPTISTSPIAKQQQLQKRTKGFGTSSQSSREDHEQPTAFGSWSVGVQKVAWRYMWNFGDEIRYVNDYGKSLGTAILNEITNPLAGTVCVNEGLSRRIPPNERMVYIDWEGDNVSFLTGSVSIQLPRRLQFDRTRQLRPFYTEFCVFQSVIVPSNNENDVATNGEIEPTLPQLICSKMSRVYNYEGRLKQGITSFLTFQRFGIDTE